MAYREATDKIPLFSIQNFCLHDGPGIRSVIFVKGCPLRCAWCQNPESWKKTAQIGFKKKLCIGCEECVSACKTGAMISPGNIDTKFCQTCFDCTKACPTGSLVKYGDFYSPRQAFEEIKGEFPYFKNTGGGVTISGGEPFLYPEFGARLGQLLKNENINLTVETCGFFNMEKDDFNRTHILEFLENIDFLIYDLKLFDSSMHKQYCKTDNKNIKQNFTLIYNSGMVNLWPRLPLIPKITATKENINSIARFLNNLGIDYITLVPFHKLGLSKREWLGLDIGIEIDPIKDSDISKAVKIFGEYGIKCYEPGEEEW